MHPDRIFVTGVTGSGSVNAPTKRKKSYSFNLEQLFSPDLFISNGVTALLDGGGIYLAHIPKKHIKPELLKGE